MTGIRRVGLLAGAVTLTGILANTLVAPALPDIERDLGASETALGAIVALASLPGVVLAPVIGLLADRFGRRAVLVPCLLVFGAGGTAAMVAPDLGWLLAARFAQGAGAAGLVNLAVVILGDHFDGIDRARAIGRNAAVLTAGLAVLPLVGGGLTALGGWRLAFAPYLLAFVVAAAVARVLPRTAPARVVALATQMRGARRYLADRRAAAMVASGFVAFVLVFGLGLTALPIHLDREFDAGALLRGLVLGVPALASVTVSLRMGHLTERYGTWPLVVVGFAALGVAFGAVAVAPALGVVAVVVLMWGLGEALTIVPLQAYAAAIAPESHRGVVVAVWVSGARAGQATGPLVAGALIHRLGTPAAFALGAAVSIAASLVLLTARRTLARPTSATVGLPAGEG